jgi:hypothetical protein
MQKIIQIYPCLLKLSRKQESVTDGRYYYIPSPQSRGEHLHIKIYFCFVDEERKKKRKERKKKNMSKRKKTKYTVSLNSTLIQIFV